VEHVFGTLKHWMGSTNFVTKALAYVSIEMMPACVQPQAGSANSDGREDDEGDEAGGERKRLASKWLRLAPPRTVLNSKVVTTPWRRR